mgnify:CR=1 FL=1
MRAPTLPCRCRVIRRTITCLGLALVCGGTAAGSLPLPSGVAGPVADYRARIPGWLADERIPGLSVVLLVDGRVAWAEGFGHTDDRRRAPVTPDTLFSLQSNSKAFTALAVLVAVQEGRLSLDAPISGYLPGFTLQSRFETRPETRITLRHLLSHTAGLAHEAPVGNNYDHVPEAFEAHIQSIGRTWLRYPVGERYCYSNLGLDLAGYILQTVYGEAFPECVKKRLLRPLGMARSSFDIREILRNPDRAAGHDPYEPHPSAVIPMIPAGGLFSSAREMGMFLRFHLQRGRAGDSPVLEEGLLEELAAIPRPRPGQRDGYALGVYRSVQHGTYSLSHSGGGFGFLSYMLWYPELGLGAAVLTNATGHNRHADLAEGLLDAIIAATGRAAAGPEAKSTLDQPPPAADTRQWHGTYLSERYREWIIEAEGAGLALRTSSGRYPLRFTAADEAEFDRGETVSHVRFYAGGQGRPATVASVADGTVFDRNDGPGDPPGPDRPEWRRFEGRYRQRVRGLPGELVTIGIRNGFLYANGLRLTEQAPGLFFGCTGDVVDFRGPVPAFRNIPLEPIEIDPLDLAILGIGGLMLLLAGLAEAWVRIRRRRLGAGLDSVHPGQRWASGVAWAAAATTGSVFGVVLTCFPQVIGIGLLWNPRLPLALKAAYWAPAAAALLTGITLVCLALAWTRWRWPSELRQGYAAVAVSLAAGVMLMRLWRLLPF